jgi:plastocyanin
MTDDLKFEPARVDVHSGDTVEWHNTSSMPHTVTADARRAAEGKEVVLPSDAAPFDSGRIATGGTFRHTFTVPGTYKYICIPHAAFGMAGEVIVKPGGTGPLHPPIKTSKQAQHEAIEDHAKKGAEELHGLPLGLPGEILRWLGKFHPAAANFPIALLVAAAVAEILLVATGRQSFDAANRFCLWFGAIAAVLTGTLGWFMGGFRTADSSWVMTTHRWLGTSTDVVAVVALLVGEASRRPGRQTARRWFRVLLIIVALMVLVAGFFGGALLYGIRHYQWPPTSAGATANSCSPESPTLSNSYSIQHWRSITLAAGRLGIDRIAFRRKPRSTVCASNWCMPDKLSRFGRRHPNCTAFSLPFPTTRWTSIMTIKHFQNLVIGTE